MKWLVLVLVLSLTSFPLSLAAQPRDCKVDSAFANGVLTDEPHANDEAIVVSFALESRWEELNTGQMLVLYHRDDGLNNLAEVFHLKNSEAEEFAKRQALMDRVFSVMGLNNKALALNWPTGRLVASVQQFIASKSFSPEILKRVSSQTADDARQISSELNSGRPLLIVAHSMGNLYTNAAVLSLNDRVSPGTLSVLGLGVPAAFVVSDNQTNNRLLAKGDPEAMAKVASAPYVTNTNDLVIETLRQLGSPNWRSPLAGNVTNSPLEPPGHSFIDIYWHSGKPTGEMALSYAGQQVTRLFDECMHRHPTAANAPSRDVAPTHDEKLPGPVLPYPNAATGGDSFELPGEVVKSIDANFRWKPTHDAALAFASASLSYWLSVAKQDWHYNQVANERVGAAQVCLRTLIRKAPRPDGTLEESYLRLILAPLTAKKSLFEKYSNADAVASGHPLLLNLDMGTSCKTVGVSING
ncbi:exported protein of unknown function [Pararobbsia alpina]|uniref:hypothetical protein n=1 Tax=Pararobbsia alpina TaxID=621374 RepID=UPI0039A50AA0